MAILPSLFPLFASLVAFIAITMFFARRKKKSRQDHIDEIFAKRQSLSEPAFYQRYFQKKGIPMYVAMGVRQVLEEVLDTDLSRLTADDDFTANLKFFLETDSLADVEIISELEGKFGIKITNEDAEKMTTVTSIVDCVWHKERQKTKLIP